MGALLDTNVVLDALARREPWHRDASDLLALAAWGKVSLSVSGSTVTDIYYLVNKYVCHDRERSLQVVRTLLDSLSVVSVGFEECLMGAHSDVRDFEDAVVSEAARTAGLEYIVTRNERDFAGGPVPTISPHDYLELVAPADPEGPGGRRGDVSP